MLALDEERILFRAAAAQRDFWLLIAGVQDQRRRRELLERRAALDGKLRGDTSQRRGIPWCQGISATIGPTRDVYVAERRRVGCGPQQLQLSRRASARRKIRVIAERAQLSFRELADVIGVEYKTIINHLAGRKMAGARVDWYQRLEAIDVADDCITIVMRYRPTRKRWGWRGGRCRSYSVAV